ncbi:RNA polymerase sigma-70 factor (ECF subfamily) [Kitasatospora sp. MAA19]|uniref:RNA polymerase sigma factor SigM n=1 Tax=unclassified Kitasatospora TaxID=2633591 RepID=UPI002474D7C1|nr:RNA polymerase sigma factor SigM [Kitasatospora sp. MAA19]MDH6703662.1 RNA polymerase sigma-70 factor (ECF subfamily) [Kitasatospora sp. MAA19]
MTTADDDAVLLARHVAGDPDAFGFLVNRHRDRLWAVALRTLGDREEAADALQDALVSAFRAAPGFQGRSAVTTWLHRIVVNACLDRARRSATRRTTPLDEDPRRLDTLVGAAEPADSPVVRAEVRRELTAALAELPAEQRAALVLVDMQGYPVAEAAELLGVPVGTVKSRCARGRARLLPLVRHLRENGGGADVSRETPDGPGPARPSRRSAPGNPTDTRTVTGTGPNTGRTVLEGDASTR